MPWGIAAAVVGAGLGAVNSNQDRQHAKGVANSINARYDPLIKRASAIADRPYTPYGGEMVSPLSTNQVSAGALASREGKNVSTYNALAGRKWDASTQKQYMNPYISGVLDSSARSLKQNYGSQIADQNRKSGMQDAFGVGRSAALSGALNRNYNTALTDLYGTGNAAAYQSGLGQFMNDSSRYSAMSNNAIRNLEDTGATAYSQQQADDLSKYRAFVEQRDWSVNNIGPLLQALGQSANGQVSASPTDQLGQIMGGAMAGAGLYKQFASNGSQWNGSAKSPTYFSSGGDMGGYNGGYVVNLPTGGP